MNSRVLELIRAAARRGERSLTIDEPGEWLIVDPLVFCYELDEATRLFNLGFAQALARRMARGEPDGNTSNISEPAVHKEQQR